MNLNAVKPQHAMEAEQALLGCLMLDPQSVIPELISRGLEAEAFMDGRHGELFDLCVNLFESGKPVDLITITTPLRESGDLDRMGGIPYIAGLPDATPSAVNWEYYASEIIERWLRRRVIGLGQRLLMAANSDESAQEMMDRAEKELMSISSKATGTKEVSMMDSVREQIAYFEACWEGRPEVLGLSTGFSDLDDMTNGLKAGDMFVIAGRPSTGKTAISTNIAQHVAVTLKKPVGFFSLEMSQGAVTRRMLCSEARLNERMVVKRQVVEKAFQTLVTCAPRVGGAPIHIDDTGGLNILQLRSRARRMKQRFGIELLVVDYLQLLSSTSTKRGEHNRQQEIAMISNGIKSLLKELGIPGLVLAQLNRDMEKEKHRKPRLSDLRESGAIEQDADIVGMLYCPDDPEETHPEMPSVNLLITKQRNGPTGDVPFIFFKSYTRFEQRDKNSV